MKVAERIKTSKNPSLTALEKQHMKLVQEAIEEGVYNAPKPKEETMRNAGIPTNHGSDRFILNN